MFGSVTVSISLTVSITRIPVSRSSTVELVPLPVVKPQLHFGSGRDAIIISYDNNANKKNGWNGGFVGGK